MTENPKRKSRGRFKLAAMIGLTAGLVVAVGFLLYWTWPSGGAAQTPNVTARIAQAEEPVDTAVPKAVWCEQAPDNDCLKPAAASGKRVLVLFTAKWCGWCRLFHEKILPDPEVQKFLSNFYLIEVDSERAKDLIEAVGIEGYPTWFVFEKGMSEGIDSHVGGFRTSEAFIERFKKDIAP